MKKFVTVILAMSAIINPTEAEQVVVTPTNSSGFSETPVLDYNLATQEFTVDFGEVDEISSGRVVIHDDSGGYRFTNGLTSDLYVFMNNRNNIKLLRMGNRYGDSSSD